MLSANSISVIFYHVCASGSTPGDIHLLHIFVVFCAFRRLYEVQLQVFMCCLVPAFSKFYIRDLSVVCCFSFCFQQFYILSFVYSFLF